MALPGACCGPSPFVDQIFIKAQRIRTIQEKGTQRVGDDIAGEFKGMVNYGVIGLIQLELIGQCRRGPAGGRCRKTIYRKDRFYQRHDAG